jgi:hypothetical protein
MADKKPPSKTKARVVVRRLNREGKARKDQEDIWRAAFSEGFQIGWWEEIFLCVRDFLLDKKPAKAISRVTGLTLDEVNRYARARYK